MSVLPKFRVVQYLQENFDFLVISFIHKSLIRKVGSTGICLVFGTLCNNITYFSISNEILETMFLSLEVLVINFIFKGMQGKLCFSSIKNIR